MSTKIEVVVLFDASCLFSRLSTLSGPPIFELFTKRVKYTRAGFNMVVV